MNHPPFRLITMIATFTMLLLLPASRAVAQGEPVVSPAAGNAVQVTTLEFQPIEDTYVDSTPANADTSFAGAETLQIGRVNLGQLSLRQRTYLRFDLSSIPPGAQLRSAALDLYQSTAGVGSPVLVYPVASTWDAASATWNNQPDVGSSESWGAAPTTDQYITFASRTFLGLVQNWVNTPSSNFGLMLDLNSTFGDARVFYSSENSGSRPPLLRITFDLPPIRVCDDAACLKPAAGVDVIDITSSQVYTTDQTGYVQDDGVIQLGDVLWARIVADQGPDYVRYRTSGDAQTVDADAFVLYPSYNVPEMRLVLQRPLLVRDLQVSAQWNLEGDPAYKELLNARIIDTSEHFYRFTGGQFALGKVTVYQNYEQWDADQTDLWLHTGNAMRPLSYIKGDVSVATPDPMTPTVEAIYVPGHMYIGSHWNRYGVPPGQPLPPGVDTSRDWAAALAHELGHYLLGQFDSYLSVLPSGVVTETFACTGSAMGFVYTAGNQSFVWDDAHWATACATTLGAYNLHRTEWQTIRTWFPWTVTPATTTPYLVGPPIPLTSVTFVAPSGPAPLVNQVFDLEYQAGELPSGEARAFLLRDTNADGAPDRVLDQGRPPQNVAPAQVVLTGAQASDRLCVIDIDDFAELPESPRHQFGCETIQAGDSALTMRREPAWAPFIVVAPRSPTQVVISVTQALEGSTLVARLYPEHDAAPTPDLTLTRSGNTWSGVFNVAGLTSSAFVQVWVEETATETSPRREAIVDYGIGGGAVPGPKQIIGFAPVTSSDGKAFFLLPANLELQANQFVAIQSMAGTPPLPGGRRIFGQAYHLMALPPELVAQGSINLYLANGSPGLVSAAASLAQEARSIYFWDGTRWEKLPTSFSTNSEGEVLASAASRGVGIYAVLIEASDVIYLPIMRRWETGRQGDREIGR